MLKSASHTPQKPVSPIEKTIAKVLGAVPRTSSGSVDAKSINYLGSYEFSKSWRGLKIKPGGIPIHPQIHPTQAPSQPLTAAQIRKRQAGERAVIADIQSSSRPLDLNGTAIIQAIKGDKRLNIAHVLNCMAWMEFAASFTENKPQVAALVLHLATTGVLSGQVDRDTFGDAISTMVASPSYSAATAWQHVSGNTAAHQEPTVQRASGLPRDEKSQSQARQVQPPARNPSPTTDLVEGMFNTVGVARESKREESPTRTVVHDAHAPGHPTSSSTAESRQAITPLAPVLPQSSSSSSPAQIAPPLEKLADDLLAAKGGEKLTRDVARGLEKLALELGGIHGASDEEMLGHAKAVVLENKMAVGHRMFQELAHVTPLRQPLRDFIADWQKRAEAAQHETPRPPQRAIKVFATTSSWADNR